MRHRCTIYDCQLTVDLPLSADPYREVLCPRHAREQAKQHFEDFDESEVVVDKPNDETYRQLIRRIKYR